MTLANPAAVALPANHPPWFGLFNDPWRFGVILTALILSLPLLTVVSAIFEPTGDVWRHLADTVLQDYVTNSLLLMIGVAVGTLFIGTTTAWLCSMCQFPGRKIFEWALLLPMAIPAYIIAYTYTGMLDFAGPVQTALRETFGWSYGDYWFPEIRSMGGAISMLSLVLYPYVYLLARAAFMEQSVCVLEVSRTLGCGPWRTFMKVALPLARPAIIAGLSLALMETLADYGTVQYFGISTFTTGIFRTWFGLGDMAAATQLAAVMMSFVFVLIIIERWSRRRARYHHTTTRYRVLPRYQLRGWERAASFSLCLLVVGFGFILPAGQLGIWTVETAPDMMNAEFWKLVWNSLALAAAAAFIALAIALFMAWGHRIRGSRIVAIALRVAGMGYAIPGVVIAVGVMLPFAWLDNRINTTLNASFGFAPGLLLSGTLFALLFAYCVRFLAVSLQTVEAGLGKIRLSVDEAARSLGLSSLRIPFRIHIPMMRGTLFTALLLVFVDVLKELPATLVLRPFNFNTLAVRAFELASDERLADAASAAIMIVAAGIIPVIMLSRSISSSRVSDV